MKIGTLEPNRIYHMDVLDGIRELPDGGVDLIVTDPPYGMKFMGKAWDKAVPGPDVWKECLRVLKPGSFCFVMCIPRQDCMGKMILNLQEAGFRMDFTSLYWSYATGFPKAMNMSKAVDKKLGVKQKVVGKKTVDIGMQGGQMHSGRPVEIKLVNKTVPTSLEATKMDGAYAGYQPKPAVEVILVAMKPLSEKTFADQAIENGKGVTWLDSCRIPFKNNSDKNTTENKNKHADFGSGVRGNKIYSKDKRLRSEHGNYDAEKGRFPANTISTDSQLGENSKFFDLDAWWLQKLEGLPENIRKTLPFLVTPKPSRSERNQGLTDFTPKLERQYNIKTNVKNGKVTGPHTESPKANHHPTVKPVKLMGYLISLGSRPGDLVLDPYIGSGTTGMAAVIFSRKYIGFDDNKEYCEIATARIGAVANGLSNEDIKAGQGSLFENPM